MSVFLFTCAALVHKKQPALIVPLRRPRESVLWSKGVTKVTYLDPDQGFSRSMAHCSVSSPTLSKMTSNLITQSQKRDYFRFFNTFFFLQVPTNYLTNVSLERFYTVTAHTVHTSPSFLASERCLLECSPPPRRPPAL